MNSNGNSLSQQAVRITVTGQSTEIGVIEYNSRGARLVLKGDIQKGGCFPVSISHLSNQVDCWAQVLWTKPLAEGQLVAGVAFTDPPSGEPGVATPRPASRKQPSSRNSVDDFWSTALDLWS